MQLSLESVLGSKNKIKLLRFLCSEKDWQFNLAEISRKIGVDKGALSRLIKGFEKQAVIETKRSGKLLLFKLNEKNKIVSGQIKRLFVGGKSD
ncbi:hypothetical protein ACFLZZ_02510 [Nanoarchaeota archaeon]